MLGGNPEGMAKVELKRQGVPLDAADYDAKLAELTRKYAEQISSRQGEGQSGRRALRGRHRDGTSRGESTTSSGGVPGVKATKGSRGSTCHSVTTS